VACGGGTGERARGEGGGESESETGLGTVAGRGRELKEDGTRVFGRKGTPRRAGPPAGGGQFAAPFFLIHLASPPTRPSLSRLPGSPSLSLRQSIGCEILLSLSFSPSLSLSLSLSLFLPALRFIRASFRGFPSARLIFSASAERADCDSARRQLTRSIFSAELHRARNHCATRINVDEIGSRLLVARTLPARDGRSYR